VAEEPELGVVDVHLGAVAGEQVAASVGGFDVDGGRGGVP
jgi:hypothetical protein